MKLFNLTLIGSAEKKDQRFTDSIGVVDGKTYSHGCILVSDYCNLQEGEDYTWEQAKEILGTNDDGSLGTGEPNRLQGRR